MKKIATITFLRSPGCIPVLMALLFGFAHNALAAPARVGELGRAEALHFEGNQTFTKEQILSAMTWDMDYHAASHRAASLPNFTAQLARKIRVGYQHGGFPDVEVNVAPNSNGQRIDVQIKEGPRYRCGDLVLTGVSSMTNRLIRQKLSEVLDGLETPNNPSETSRIGLQWAKDKPVPFDTGSATQLVALVNSGLEQLGYFMPKVKVRIARQASREVADLHVEIASEGIKGTIEEIEITGLRTNTREQLLDYLKLRKGMDLDPLAASATDKKLMESGRFLLHVVTLQPAEGTGKFKLDLDLEELPHAPALDQLFPPETQAMMRFREWLLHLSENEHDIVCSVSSTDIIGPIEMELILSGSGMAFLGRSPSSNAAPRFDYAAVLSKKVLGLYSATRQAKHVSSYSTDRTYTSFLRVEPNVAKRHEWPANRFNITVGMGLNGSLGKSSQPAHGSPIQWTTFLHPSVFVVDMKKQGTNMVLKDGVLRIAGDAGPLGEPYVARIDAKTGRLIDCKVTSTNGTLTIRSQEGAFAQALTDIAAASAGYRNYYVTNQGFSSGLTFVVAEAVASTASKMLVKRLAAETNKFGAALPKITALFTLAQDMLNRDALSSIFEPLNGLIPDAGDTDEEEDRFIIPASEVLGSGPASNPMMAMAGAWLAGSADRVFSRGSWPWVLLRENAFMLGGRPDYFAMEMEKLVTSEDLGPLGCLVAAASVGKHNPKLARAFAEQGARRSTSAGFRLDYDALVHTNSITSAVCARTLAVAGKVDDQRIDELSRGPEAAFARDVANSVRGAPGADAAAAAWPAFERHFTNVFRSRIELALNHFLPQSRFLEDPAALYRRAMSLVAPGAVFQDSAEALACFRKAATKGHPGAQLQLGTFFEQGNGVEKDYAEAMRWFRSAAASNELHAACRIGDMYMAGHGVDADTEQAVRWYRIDAERGCVGSQHRLGDIALRENKTSEALEWLRKAANGGAVEAQAQLGDLLSDGLLTAPDYVEACQWLNLATQAGHKMSELRLRRAKARLTEEQVEQVAKRVSEFKERQEQEAEKVKAKAKS